MLAALLWAALAAKEPPDLWRYEGADTEALRAAIVAALGPDPGPHVATELGLDAALDAAKLPAALDCLDDSATCSDPTRAGLRLVAAGALVVASFTQSPKGFRVTLVRTPAGESEALLTVLGEGESLVEAARAALDRLRGTGAVSLSVSPADAEIWLDGRPVGRGPGAYLVAPGRHKLGATSAYFRPAEQPVEIEAGERLALTFDLEPLTGKLTLDYKPPEASVQLDDKPFAKAPGTYDAPAGTHSIRLALEGYEPHEQDYSLEPGALHLVKTELEPGDALWWKKPHPDTIAHPYYARADLRVLSVGSGLVGDGVGRGVERIEVDGLNDSMTLWGIDAGIGWRGRYLLIEALGLTYAAGGSSVGADTEVGGTKEAGSVDSASRTIARFAWVGGRYPVWRIEPYAQGGLLAIFESFDVDVEGQKRKSLSRSALAFGIELGGRYHVTDAWFGAIGGVFDFWPDERTTSTLVVGGGFAMDKPEGL